MTSDQSSVISKRKRVLIRVIGAPLLLAALGGVLYLDYRNQSILGLTIIMAVFTLGGLHEFYRMCELKGHKPDRWIGLLAAAAVVVSRYMQSREFINSENRDVTLGMVIAFFNPHSVFIFYLFVKLIFRFGVFSFVDAALSYFGFIYLTLWTQVIAASVFSLWWVLLFLIATNKGHDMAAYISGKLFGRTKLAPQISPNKTWVGLVAGIAVGSLLGYLVLTQSHLCGGEGMRFRDVYWLAFSVLVTLTASIGDLLESALKRWAGVKDSGVMLPEFGGFLDMVDGFLLSSFFVSIVANRSTS